MEYVERHVDFADDVLDDAEGKEGKLRQRDTPHHLKNKSIYVASTKLEDAEEKVRAILAQAAGHRESIESGTTPSSDQVTPHTNFIIF